MKPEFEFLLNKFLTNISFLYNPIVIKDKNYVKIELEKSVFYLYDIQRINRLVDIFFGVFYKRIRIVCNDKLKMVIEVWFE